MAMEQDPGPWVRPNFRMAVDKLRGVGQSPANACIHVDWT